jgi:hypothetical protein
MTDKIITVIENNNIFTYSEYITDNQLAYPKNNIIIRIRCPYKTIYGKIINQTHNISKLNNLATDLCFENIYGPVIFTKNIKWQLKELLESRYENSYHMEIISKKELKKFPNKYFENQDDTNGIYYDEELGIIKGRDYLNSDILFEEDTFINDCIIIHNSYDVNDPNHYVDDPNHYSYDDDDGYDDNDNDDDDNNDDDDVDDDDDE